MSADSFSRPHHHPDVVDSTTPRPTGHPHSDTPLHPSVQGRPSIRVAIVDSNMLACMGLHHILQNIIPIATVQVYHSFDDLMADEPEGFAHYFVSARLYFEHTQFFRRQAYRTIVLINGENLPPMPGILTLNICRSEQEVVTDLLQLHSHGHGRGPHVVRQPMSQEHHAEIQPLTAREIEVVTLLAKGFINKEIADKLHISLTTVITHRKNIMTKLNAHSLSDVIIYAVMNGHIDLGE